MFNINTTTFNTGLTNTYNNGNIKLLESNTPAFADFNKSQTTNPVSRFDSGNYSTIKYNEQFHEIELYLDNSGNFDNPKRFFINPSAVLGLIIRDTVNDWIVDGSMTFMYFPEEPPTSQKTKTAQSRQTQIDGAIQNGNVLRNYQFRGDGFDLLRIMIAPKSFPVGKTNYGSSSLKLDKSDTKWVLSYLFSVYDIEDVNDVPTIQGPMSAYIKCLKLKFHDVRYQILKTTNLEYSTANTRGSVLTPSGNYVVETGKAMVDVLNQALSLPEVGGCDEFEVQVDDSTWDTGASKIFYTSPAQNSAYDDLQYLYSHHVSKKIIEGGDGPLNDLCLLHTDRPKNHGFLEPIVLTPISNMFEKAGSDQPGDLQKEHFFVTAHTSEQEPPGQFRAPLGKTNDKNKDLKTFKYGQIVSYSFVDMSPDINSTLLATTPVYSVDIGRRKFNIQFKNNDVLTARKAISKAYISKLYKEGTEEDLFLPILHKSKKDRNVFPTFTLNGEDTEDGKVLRQKNAFHQLLYTGLFQNACICFKTFGLTFRESGTFIGIDKTAGCADNDFNNKLYGQWFVVKVDHLFESGVYMNVIYAVKLHRYKKRTSEFDSTIDKPN